MKPEGLRMKRAPCEVLAERVRKTAMVADGMTRL